MAEQVVSIGAPFAGMGDVPEPKTGVQTIAVGNLLCREGLLECVPQERNLDAFRMANRGQYVWGVGSRAILVTLGAGADGQIVYKASRGDFSVLKNLTEVYGERPTREEVYSFASLGRKLYFAGGQGVFEVDLETLDCAPVTFTYGSQSQTVAYLVSCPPVRRLVVYQERMFYCLSEDFDGRTHYTVDPTDPLVDLVAWRINSDGTIHYSPEDFLFSDNFEPGHVQFWSAQTFIKDGSEVTALVPWQSQLVILTTKSLWTLVGDNPGNWVVTEASQYAGCIAPASVVTTGNAVLWVGVNAIWRLSAKEGLDRVPGMDWFFDFGASAMRKLYSYGREDRDISHPVWVAGPQPASLSGCSFMGGKYAVWAGKGTRAFLFLEIATGAASVVEHTGGVGQVAVSACESSNLLGAMGGMLMGFTNDPVLEVPSLASRTTGDAPNNWFSPTYVIVRVQGNGMQRRILRRSTVGLSAAARSVALYAYAIEELVRVGGTTAPAVNTGNADWTLEPPGGVEEGSTWDQEAAPAFNWVGAPLMVIGPGGSLIIGQTQPRWSVDAPASYTLNGTQIAKDLLVVLMLSVREPTTLEYLNLLVDTEAAP